MTHFDSAVARFDELDDVHSRAEALRLKGMAALYRSDAAAAEDPIAQSLIAFRQVEDRRGEAWALQNLAWISFVTGRIVDAESRLGEAFAAFTEIDDQTGLAWTEGLLAFVRFYQGRFAEAGELASRILRESERRNDRWAQAMMLIVIGAIDLWEGRTGAALEVANRSVSLFTSIGDPTGLQQALTLSGRGHLMSGYITEGLEMVDRAVGDLTIDTIGPQSMMSVASSIAARVQLGVEQAFDPLTVAKLIQNDAAGERPAEFVAAVSLALVQAGHLEAAVELLAVDHDAQRFADRKGSVLNGYALSSRALIAAIQGDHEAVAAIDAQVGDDSTYLDRAMVKIALGLGRASSWIDDFAHARAEVDGTGDRLTRATIDLARASVAEAVGHDADVTWRDEAEASWTELGVDPVGWRLVFSLATATAPAGA